MRDIHDKIDERIHEYKYDKSQYNFKLFADLYKLSGEK